MCPQHFFAKQDLMSKCNVGFHIGTKWRKWDKMVNMEGESWLKKNEMTMGKDCIYLLIYLYTNSNVLK